MPHHVRSGAAFRSRLTAPSGQASDVLRVFERDGLLLALLANGYEGGFSACWPPASRLILDLFVEEWSATSGPVRARLEAAFNGAGRRFIEQSPSRVTPDADFPDDLPSAVLLVVAIEERAIHMAWVGGDVAVLVRGLHAVTATTPHTLVEHFKRERPEVTDLSQVPNVVIRNIAKHAPQQGSADYLAATVEAGDTLVLLSRAPFRGPCVSIHDAARAAAEHASPAALAERLADVAFAETDAPYAAVIAVRWAR